MRRILKPKSHLGWLDVILVIAGVVLLVRTSENISRMVKNASALGQAEVKLASLQEDNIRLQGELRWVQSPEFVEQEARDKLGMGREGEVMVIIGSGDQVDDNQVLNTSVKSEPVWRKWWNLYIKI